MGQSEPRPPSTLRRRSLLLGAVAATSATSTSASASAATRHPATSGWTEKLIGTPLHSVATNASTFAAGPDGRELAYLALDGHPAQLAVVDVRHNELVQQLDLPGSTGANTLVVADSAVYVGTSNGAQLIRHAPEQQQVERLGLPHPSARATYSLALDHEGCVFGGTWPTGSVFSYDPRADQFRDYGQVADGWDYVRSVAVARETIYAGVGTLGARLFAMDKASGAKREISFPSIIRDHVTVYDLAVRRRYLFAWVTVTGSENNLLVYDLETRQWVQDLGTIEGEMVSPVGPRSEVYFVARGGDLTSYDLVTGDTRTTPQSGTWDAKGFGWVDLSGDDTGGDVSATATTGGRNAFPGRTLVMSDFQGRLWFYNPRTESREIRVAPLQGEPVSLQSLVLGPDDRVYASGYHSGGLAVYEPANGQLTQYPRGVGQAEGMHAHGDRLYLGVYSGASLLSFDPERPFAYGTNPTVLGSLRSEDQDRPFAWTSAGDLVMTGTVPGYGRLGGALTAIEHATGAYQVYRNVVAEQSVVALTYANGLVVGGTSVWGGLGIRPSRAEAALFLWDPRTREKVWEGVPLPGERAVTGLAVTGDGHVWGITVGKVFEFDPAAREVVRVLEIAPFDWSKVGHVWVSGQIEARRPTELLVLARKQLHVLDTESGATRRLATDVKRFVRTPDDRLYFSRVHDLYRLDRP